jgi:dolichol-phosphate mannosyltransferase
MKYIILIPTYNESKNIEKIISDIFNLQKDVHIKIIDDNSPDGTSDIVKKLTYIYPSLSLLSRAKKEGLGKAYVNGFMEVLKDTEATHVFMMDADMSHDPKYLSKMIEESQSFDLVIGSRYIAGGKTKGWEMWRKILSYLGNLYVRTVTRMHIKDMTGGFNCIKISVLREVNRDEVDSSGYAFIMQLKHALHKKGARIKEIPIVFVNRFGGESKISNNIISEGIIAPWKMIWKK